MKQTLILSKIERAAFAGAMADVARARQAFDVAQAAAEEVIAEVISAHKAPPVKRGGSVSGDVINGRHAIVYEAVDSKAEAASGKSEIKDVAAEALELAATAAASGGGNGSAKE